MIARERAEVIGGARLAVQTVLGPTPPLDVIACDTDRGHVVLHFSGLPRGHVLVVTTGTGELTPVSVVLRCWDCGADRGDLTCAEDLTVLSAATHECPASDANIAPRPAGRWLVEGSPEYRLLSAVEDMIAAATRRGEV